MANMRWSVVLAGLWLGGCGNSGATAPTTPGAAGGTGAENSATTDGSGGGSADSGTAAATGACAPDDASTWSACAGQRVTLAGEVAKMVHQHPILAVPAELTPDGADGEQGYIDAAGVQLIVLTSTPITCTGAITAEGLLERVSLGDPDSDGSTRAKTSYSGWKLSGATVSCAP